MGEKEDKRDGGRKEIGTVRENELSLINTIVTIADGPAATHLSDR